MIGKQISNYFVFMILLSAVFLNGFLINTRIVHASNTIYIRSDGSIEPGTAPISSSDNITYTIITNIYDIIIVERSNIVIDGDGYLVRGAGGGNGFHLSSVQNVVIQNVNIKSMRHGIYLDDSHDCILMGNTIESNSIGIALSTSSNNEISGNTMTTNDEHAIKITSSHNNTISENTLANTERWGHIFVSDPSNNTIMGNSVKDGDWTGIFFEQSSNNIIAYNNIINNQHYGLEFQFSSNNNIAMENNISNCYYGIVSIHSVDNVIYYNRIIDNTNQVMLVNATDQWDDGIGKGNYWSNYESRYPDAAEIDGTGIWDTPYVIETGIQDNYPIVESASVNKIFTSTMCSVSAAEITQDDSITITGAITPALAGETVSITYTKPDQSSVERTATTGTDGSFSDTFTPDAAGSWSVIASCADSGTIRGSSSPSESFTVNAKAMCIVATATFGSELSPQVQFLRGFRDYRVLTTFAGSQFMTVFNGFYYSFSPSVASTLYDNGPLRQIMKGVLYPLIGALQLSEGAFSIFSFNQEIGVIMAGFLTSSLIAIIYLAPLSIILSYLKKYIPSMRIIRGIGVIFLVSIGMMLIAEVTLMPILMMISTAVFVLSTISLTTLVTTKSVSSHFLKKFTKLS